jgi:transmembrane sensor
MDDDAAARWAIRLDNGPLDADEQAKLNEWLSGNERRRGSLLRAEATLAYLDRGRALAQPHDEGDHHPAAMGRRAFLIAGSLAGLSAAGFAGIFVGRSRSIEIQTAIGEVRRVPLADGSVASVNTNSKIVVEMLDKRREVKLEDGEAWFQVARDKSRPFIVATGDVRVQAVGTAFAVRRWTDGADVLVTEGVVDVWVAGHEHTRTRVAAGSKSFVAESTPAVKVTQASGDIDRALAWRTGELALDGENLGYAAAEFNRYNVRKLVIDDPTLGAEPLVGYFRTDQPENFGRAVAAMVGARVEVEGETIRLSRPGSQKNRP